MDLEEGGLVFEFSDPWNVLKLDEHSDYRERIAKLEGTKAVDFLGILDEALYLIEVKDFRGHRIENKDRLTSGELSIEIGQKVRDSLACVVGAYRTSSAPETWTPFVRILSDKLKAVKVVLWVEHDLPDHHLARRKAKASVETQVFKKKLNWLTSQVLVCNLAANTLSGVQVRNLPHSHVGA